MTTAKFIYDTSFRCVDLYYATRFKAPDAFIYFEARGKKVMVMNDLEIDRAKKTACVDTVLSLSKYTKKAKQKNVKPTTIDILDTIFCERGIKKLEVPSTMPFTLVDQLRKRHYKVVSGSVPFYKSRLYKSKEEKKLITNSQKVVFKMFDLAEKTLHSCKIKKGYLYCNGKLLTSEILREMLQVELMRRNFEVPDGTIVACGRDATDPHNLGNGPLQAHKAIIIDIFPRSMDTLFWGDATRTFSVGKAPDKLGKLYNAVKAGQEYALKNIKAGINGHDIHKTILKMFEERGFKTGEFSGRMQGFFHSTGHGIGLEIHEPSEGCIRVGPVDQILEEGMVVSVEPGLYYKDIGGVRIEDLVYITKNGCEVLAGYPKRLEIL